MNNMPKIIKSELLACPFCGADEWYKSSDNDLWRCLNHKEGCYLGKDSIGNIRQEIISIQNIESSWNTRK